MTTSRSLLAALAAVAVTATACGGIANEPKRAGGPATPGAGGAAEAVYQPSDKTGGTLEMLQPGDCDSWDPQDTYITSCWNVQRLFSRGLVTFNSAPGQASTEIVPDLATSVAKSDDLKTWTYTLKDGVTFEDGTPITSRDVKYGVSRSFAADVLGGGPTYPKELLEGGDSYKGPYDGDKAGLPSIETPDDKTITFRLKTPFADWNSVMALPISTPVPAAKDTGAKYGQRPVASGPYKFGTYKPEEELLLVRNQAWDPRTDPERKALPDQVRIRMGTPPPDTDLRIAANQADVDLRGAGLQPAVQARLLTDPKLQARAANPTQPSVRYVSVVSTVAPFTDIHCRKAIAWAISKRDQQVARGGEKGGGQIAHTMTPPAVSAGADAGSNAFPTPEDRGDVAKAKEELAQCGQPEGFQTKIAARESGKEVAQAEALQRDLAKIGVKATIDKLDNDTYNAVTHTPGALKSKGYGLVFAGFTPDWPSPYGLFAPLAASDGSENVAALTDPSIDAAIEAGASATDQGQRAAKWQEVDRKVVESATYIPVLFDRAFLLHSQRLTNAYVTYGYGGQLDVASMGVIP